MDLNLSNEIPPLIQPDGVSSLAQLPAPTATTSLSGADIHSLGGYSHASTSGDLEQRDPAPIGGGGGGGGGNGGNGNNGNNHNKGSKSGRSKTRFGEEVNDFIPKAKQIISDARAESPSDVTDIVRTLDELLDKAKSMEGKDGDDNDQYKTFGDTINGLKRRTQDQAPISKSEALDGADNAVNDLQAWVSPGNPSFKASAWTAAAAAAAGLALL